MAEPLASFYGGPGSGLGTCEARFAVDDKARLATTLDGRHLHIWARNKVQAIRSLVFVSWEQIAAIELLEKHV